MTGRGSHLNLRYISWKGDEKTTKEKNLRERKKDSIYTKWTV